MMRTPRSILILSATLALLPTLGGCDSKEYAQTNHDRTDGNPQRGASLIPYYGCSACHTIPGIPGADAQVGPPLSHFAARPLIGGVASNNSRNLTAWIQNPHQLSPRTTMPNIDVTPQDSKDIAAYLYTLR